MLVTTTEQIAGKSYEILGLAQGSTIQCKNVGRDITQGLKQLVGGELTSYTESARYRIGAHDPCGREYGRGCCRLHALYDLRHYAGRCRGAGVWHSGKMDGCVRTEKALQKGRVLP